MQKLFYSMTLVLASSVAVAGLRAQVLAPRIDAAASDLNDDLVVSHGRALTSTIEAEIVSRPISLVQLTDGAIGDGASLRTAAIREAEKDARIASEAASRYRPD